MQFRFPSTSADGFARKLAAQWPMSGGPPRHFTGAYYDTFDWRLYLAGLALFVERSGRRYTLQLIERDSGDEIGAADSSLPPGLAETLPAGPLAERLEPVIQMRRLLPLAKLTGERTRINLLNDDEKTVLRLELTASTVNNAEEADAHLPLLLNVTGLRGYEADADAFSTWLNDQAIGTAGSGDHLDAALTAAGRKGGDYNSKLNFRLEPGTRADLASKHIMLHLLNTLEANIQGSIEDIDSEYLHDLRVAVRRTRSALTQIKGVFDDEVVEAYKEAFAWIGQITGPTRDMHVYLLKYPDYVRGLPSSYREPMEPFHAYLEKHLAVDHKALAKQLGSERFRSILADWRTFLEAPVDGSPPQGSDGAPNAARSIKEVADARIRRMARRVLKEGGAIDADSPAEDLHELRKSCKKLRYLMEFFQSLYPKKQIGRLIKVVKVLLDNLGDFQDLEVQANKLEAMAEELRKSRIDTRTLLSLGMLIENLLTRQQQERHRFASQFGAFSSAENRAAFNALFKPVSPPESTVATQSESTSRP